MPAHVLIVDLFALLAMLVGFHMVFRQRQVRRWWRIVRPRDPSAPPPVEQPQAEDPAYYALAIFGMMLLAFGLIMFAFMTAFALLS